MSTLIPAEITKRHFLIPAALALSAHAVVLFGFTKNNAASSPFAPPTYCSHHPAVQRIDFFPPPDDESIANQKPNSADRRNELTDKFAQTKFDFPGPQQAPIVPTEALPITVPPIGGGAPSHATGPDWTEVSLDKLDSQPQALAQSSPVCPYEAKHKGLSGQVQVMFTVDESGRVSNHPLPPMLSRLKPWT